MPSRLPSFSAIIFGVCLSAIPVSGFARKLSIGILGGGSVTDSFPTADLGDVRTFSTSKDYLIGPALEWNFSSRWSLEADGLFRELHFARAGFNDAPAPGNAAPGSATLGTASPAPVVTWEFPILAKYRFTASRIRPFAEAGLSFRAAGNLNGANPSRYGFTAGAGIEIPARRIVLEPVLRYTRWAQDNIVTPASGQNQLELALGLYALPRSDIHPLSSRISIGVLFGAALTRQFHPSSLDFLIGLESFSQTTSPRRGLLAGPSVEFLLPASFALEADAIYTPLQIATTASTNGVAGKPSSTSLGNWDLPLLAKRRFPAAFANLFIEAGPAFRVGTGELSHFGLAAGAGIELHAGKLAIAPTVRYQHWSDNKITAFPMGLADQVELFGAFSF